MSQTLAYPLSFVLGLAEALIAEAEKLGVGVTIKRRSLTPPAMGRHTPHITVWRAHSQATSPAAPPLDCIPQGGAGGGQSETVEADANAGATGRPCAAHARPAGTGETPEQRPAAEGNDGAAEAAQASQLTPAAAGGSDADKPGPARVFCSAWCGWVATVVGAYLGFGVDDERIPVMAQVIERRLWALPPERGAQSPAELRIEDIIILLCLVGLEPRGTTVLSWTAEQQQAAVDWASACYYRANDNDVVVPPRPAFLPEPWRGPDQGEGVFGGPGPTVF